MTALSSAMLRHTTVIVVNFTAEVLLVFFLYPRSVLSWQRLLLVKTLRMIGPKTVDTGRLHQVPIRKYGILGLFVFVWSPFWLTGPVVGSAILLGLRVWVNFGVVLVGTAMAIICWSYFLREPHETVSAFGPHGPRLLLLTIVGMVITGYLITHPIRLTDSRRFQCVRSHL